MVPSLYAETLFWYCLEQEMIKKARIREIFLQNGFTIKDGKTDLKDYVYDAAYALIDEVLRTQKPVSVLSSLGATPGPMKSEGWSDSQCKEAMIQGGATVVPRSCPSCKFGPCPRIL